MERTKNDHEVRKFKQTGRGTFLATIDGKKKYIKPGEVFSAKLSEIPVNFRDVIKPMDGVALPVEEPVKEKAPAPKPITPKSTDVVMPTPSVEVKYEVKFRGGGYYNVVDQDGKVINEKALRQEAANALLETLQ